MYVDIDSYALKKLMTDYQEYSRVEREWIVLEGLRIEEFEKE